MARGALIMNKRNLLMTALATAFLLADGVSLPSQASAQDVLVTGPLAGAPAVRHMRVYRRNRLYLEPFVGFTLQNSYQRTILFGAQAAYHFVDWLGIGATFGYGAIGVDTNLTDQIERQGVTTQRNRLSLPSREGFGQQIGQINWMGSVQVNFVPLRGKLALFQKAFLDTDFHIFAGVAFVGLTERASTSDDTIACQAAGMNPGCAAAAPTSASLNDAYLASQRANASRVAIAPTFGAGLSMYFTEWFGLNIEWRGLPFKWNDSGTDESGSASGNFPDGVINSNDRLFHFNHMFTVGFIFYVPPHARITE
jgi:outer membrane beta-barrel protein